MVGYKKWVKLDVTLGMVVHAYNLSTWEAEVGDCEFKAWLSYIVILSQKQQQQKEKEREIEKEREKDVYRCVCVLIWQLWLVLYFTVRSHA
jgi:hypothetical protein